MASYKKRRDIIERGMSVRRALAHIATLIVKRNIHTKIKPYQVAYLMRKGIRNHGK